MGQRAYHPNIAVFIIVRNEQGEILLHQRANTGYLDGYYDFPSGHVEPGEDLKTAAVRELAEEVGLVASPEDLQLIHVNQNELDTPYIGFTFVATAWQGEPTIMEPEKCSDIRFASPDSLPEKCTLGVRINERDDFSDDLSFSFVDPDRFAELMGEPYIQ